MNYLHLVEDAEGISHFEDKEFPLALTDFAPPAPELWLSDALAAKACVFLVLPAGWGGAQHRSPRNQIALCLSGRAIVEAGDGETREIGPGGIWWMADTKGSGHKTTVIGDQDMRLAIVQLS